MRTFPTTLRRTVETATAPERAFPYLADFANAAEWDSGTLSCTRLRGDGGPGSLYRNVSRFAGRTVELDYAVVRAESPTFVVVGRNHTTTTTDTIVVRPNGSGSTVDYKAEFVFSGPARFFGPLLRQLLDRLADRTAEQLRRTLDAL